MDTTTNLDLTAVADLTASTDLIAEVRATMPRQTPQGVVPKHVWDARRADNLFPTVQRYSEARRRVPADWLAELKSLLPQRDE